MLRFLAFVFTRKIYIPWGWIIKLMLLSKGVKVGKGFYIEGIPYLKVRGKASNIKIGNNVKIFGNIDLRNRENGKIQIGDNVEIDNDCRFVSANNATLKVGENVKFGPYCVLNAGADIKMGANTVCGGFVHLQSSDHGLKKGVKIWDQPHEYGEIHIGEDVWLAAAVTVLRGVKIGNGTVIATKAVVNRDVPSNAIVGGIPAKEISRRS